MKNCHHSVTMDFITFVFGAFQSLLKGVFTVVEDPIRRLKFNLQEICVPTKIPSTKIPLDFVKNNTKIKYGQKREVDRPTLYFCSNLSQILLKSSMEHSLI